MYCTLLHATDGGDACPATHPIGKLFLGFLYVFSKGDVEVEQSKGLPARDEDGRL